MADSRKTVLITGCSPGGIGYALAKEFHARGCRVFATARNESVLTSLAEMETLRLDVCSPEDVKRVKKLVEDKTGGKIDLIINNAGKAYSMPATDIDLDEVRSMFETNLFAVMRMCQEFSSLLINGKGTIVQIGSVAGVMPFVFSSPYVAAKAALHAYSDTLRVELAPFGVKVVTVITGGVKSNIARVDRKLPENSLYLPIIDGFRRRISYSQENTMPTEQYARSVVEQVLKPAPKETIWEGSNIWRVWFVYTFLPKWFFARHFSREFGLWKLTSPGAAKKDA